MRALIPMAGAGSRFAEAGYTTPKPLLPLLGEPMVVKAAQALPLSERYTFIVRDFQIEEYQIDKHLASYFPGCDVVVLDHLTEGQAVTCLKAKHLFQPEEELVIGASDNGMIYDSKVFEEAKQEADVLVFTFRNNPAVDARPQAYGWVKTKDGVEIEKMSVKVPISSAPQQDHAVVGAFWFRKAGDFVKAAERMITNNTRINNEFYVDECINDAIALGLKAKVFEIEHYVCWGTPTDYETFQYWNGYYQSITSQK
jgi:NDP-sugar pyrophosphorylase family protein